MPAAHQAFQLHLRSDLSELQRIEEWIRRAAEQLCFCPNMVDVVHLCLIEAVTNVIVHGGDDAAGRGILLSIQAQDDLVTVRVSDGGRPFDPASYVPQPKPKSLLGGQTGGHGIRLMRQLASSLSYERNAGRNCLTLTFAR